MGAFSAHSDGLNIDSRYKECSTYRSIDKLLKILSKTTVHI